MKYFLYCRKSQEAEDRQVMSLESQLDEVGRLVERDEEIAIVDRYEEACSAKQPGRPLFNEMIERIEQGDAEGILAWHPDRLARNSMDGGRIIYLLDQGKLKDLKFCTYTFENTSQGKFMLNIIFGYSKYYVDSLSENVKRGIRTKLRHGWQPNLAPTGYRNCKETSTILPDDEHFTAVRRMFDLLLSGKYTVAEIHRLIWEEWGYTTPVLKTRGGRRLSRSSLYRLFNNPFYAGYIRWKGQLHDGKHTPMVTKAEFEKVQRLLNQEHPTRSQHKTFTFGGVFTCGVCGLSVTAEHKRKKSGREYTYYHCTRIHRTPACKQPSIEEKTLATQVRQFLERITLPEKTGQHLLEELRREQPTDARQQAAERLKAQVASLRKQLANLTDLRIRELVSDEEFETKRQSVLREIGETEENARNAAKQQSMFEPLAILQILRNNAVFWFDIIDPRHISKLIEILCSNPLIADKKALLVAAKPFAQLDQWLACYHLRGDVDDVRTRDSMPKQCREQLRALATDPETIELARKAKVLIEQIEPEALAFLSARPSGAGLPPRSSRKAEADRSR